MRKPLRLGAVLAGLAPALLAAQSTTATNVAGTYAPGTALATPGSYTMPNGIVYPGNPTWWLDELYADGCSVGPCPRNTPGASLSGGTGELTDGVRPTVDALASNGYVMWNSGNTRISFLFPQVYDFSSIRLLMANGNEFLFGQIVRPGVTINGTGYGYGALNFGTESRWWEFDVTGMRTNRIDLDLGFLAGYNYGLAQADFAGTAYVAPPPGPLPDPTTVPEPSTYVLIAAGLAGLVAMRRRGPRVQDVAA
jgi:hypothetical protein